MRNFVRLPFVCLVFYIPTAQRICAISSYTDKNSRRSSAKLSACCFACFARKRINEHSFRAFLYTVFAHSKTELESQGDDRSERRAFVTHKLLLLQPQQVAVVRLGSLCSSSHTAKNFAFIFDIQAQVRLFLPCGSPCVRSTSDCAMLLRSRRIKDGGIISEMSLSMRALSVVPHYAVAVGSLLMGNGGMGATR